VAPKPVNVLIGGDYLTLAQARDAGVRRISVGGALARAAITGFLAAAKEIADQGTFTALGRSLPVPETNRLFTQTDRHGRE
jgi:methylisocitrate lyase